MLKFNYLFNAIHQLKRKYRKEITMEKYVAAELELVDLATGDVMSHSVEYDENETKEDRLDSF